MADAMNRSKSHENVRSYSLNKREESKDFSKNIKDIRKAIENQQKQDIEEVEKALTPEEKSIRKRVMFSSLLALLSINILLLCADAVLPTYIDEKYKDQINDTQVSLIFA